MKNGWIVAALTAALTAPLWAQPAPDDGPETPEHLHRHQHSGEGSGELNGSPADGYLDVLHHELDLTPDQRKAVKGVLDQSKTGREAIEKQMRSLGEQMHKKQRADNEKIRALLNDDQKERFDEFNSRLRHQEGHPMPMMHGDHEGMSMHGPMPDGGMPPPEMWHKGRGHEHGGAKPKQGETPDGPPELMPQSAPKPQSKE